MRDKAREPVGWGIADQFARWATRAAVSRRPGGAPQYAVNAELDSLNFDHVFDRSLEEIEVEEFNKWHIASVKNLREKHPALSYAWAAKHIAIYLKVTCYLAGFGRDGLKDVMHPPFDGRLLKALSKESPNIVPVALKSINSKRYYDIIFEMYEIADKRGCTLFEVEQLWSPPT